MSILALLWSTPWKFFFITLVLWPLAFRIQTAKNRGAELGQYLETTPQGTDDKPGGS